MFALVDCNRFYCSCEAVFQPRLWGKPIVVLSNNDGYVIARSPEAKTAGIPMGAPAFQWREPFAKAGVEVFSSNYRTLRRYVGPGHAGTQGRGGSH